MEPKIIKIKKNGGVKDLILTKLKLVNFEKSKEKNKNNNNTEPA
jgi:hypothetical protein